MKIKILNTRHIKIQPIIGFGYWKDIYKKENINVYDLYKKMYNGEKITYDLTCGGEAFCIKHHKDYTIDVLAKFNRVVCF